MARGRSGRSGGGAPGAAPAHNSSAHTTASWCFTWASHAAVVQGTGPSRRATCSGPRRARPQPVQRSGGAVQALRSPPRHLGVSVGAALARRGCRARVLLLGEPRSSGSGVPGHQLPVPARLPRGEQRGRVRGAHRAGPVRGGVRARAGAEPVRIGVRADLRAPVRGRVPPSGHRCPAADPGAQARGQRAARRRGRFVRSDPGQRRAPAPAHREAGPGRHRGRRARGPRLRPRSRAHGARGRRLRRGPGRGRHDAPRDPRVPSAARGARSRDRVHQVGWASSCAWASRSAARSRLPTCAATTTPCSWRLAAARGARCASRARTRRVCSPRSISCCT